jgi:GMP synthase-like glutamine amidotransferase
MIHTYNQWKKKKLLLLKMTTSNNILEQCLEFNNIPCIIYDCSLMNEVEISKAWETDKYDIRGIIVGGSITPDAIYPAFPTHILEEVDKVLGICYGCEVLAEMLGSTIIECNHPVGETGSVIITLKNDILFKGLDLSLDWAVTMNHDMMIKKLPNDCELIASTELTPIAGFHHYKKKWWGLQFHPEKDWLGSIIFKNFYDL